jgi:hypothetical protein
MLTLMERIRHFLHQTARLPVVIILGLITVYLTGCAPKAELLSCELTSPVTAITAQSKTLNIDISVDGTPSMQGYVDGFSNSRYVQTLNLLDTVASTAWANPAATVSYYRFGTKQQKLDRSTFRRAQLPEFYGGGDDLKVSNITAALPQATSQRLSLIVTDLYQQDADVTLVQQQLSQKYLQPGQAIGVLAVRSEFKGTIYDVGLRNQQFSYATSAAENTFHPFFVLMLGSYADINHFYSEFKKSRDSASLLKPGQGEFAIFFPQFVDPVSRLDPANLPKPSQGITRVTALNDGRVVARVQPKQPVDLLRIGGNAKPTSLSYTVPYRQLPHVLPIGQNVDDLAIEVTANKLPGKGQASNSAQMDGFKITDLGLDRNQMSFQLDINPSQIQRGIYSYNVAISPKELESPAWWDKWTSREGQLDGSKTHNLAQFLNALKASTTALVREQKPPIAHFCYGVWK